MLRMLQNNLAWFQHVTGCRGTYMQHGCDMIAISFANWDHYEWGGLDRRRAIEIFDDQFAYAVLLNEEAITLPAHAAKLLYACAKVGARKVQGRGSAMTGRRHAVETLRKQITNEGGVRLSLRDARMVLGSAKDGEHKGQGRRRPPNKQRDRLAKRSAVQVARDRKTELLAANEKLKATGVNSAEEKAAEEAHEWLSERDLCLSVETIIRRMQYKK